LKDSSRLLDISLQKDLQNLDNSDFNMIYGIANIKEYVGLFVLRQDFLNRTTTLIDHATKAVRIPAETKKVWDLESTRFYLSDIPIDDPDLVLRKTEKYASKYDHRLDILQENGLTSIETDRAYLYESKNYYPRANLISAKNAIYMKHDENHAENILKAVISSDFDPSKNVIIDSDKDNSNLNSDNIESGDVGNYDFESYLPQNMKVKINIREDSYFVLSDTFYPGWEAKVDDKKVVIDKANYAFRAVFIPKGEHVLQMYYQPTFDQLGKSLTEVGVVLLFFGLACFIFLKFGKMIRYERK